MKEEKSYAGAMAGPIALFFVSGILCMLFGSAFFSSFEDLAIFTIILSWTLMLVAYFASVREISWEAISYPLLFGLIGPLWALIGALLVLFGVIQF